jgi:undecaprenyl-diphosphatase
MVEAVMSFGAGTAQIGVIGVGVIGWLVALVAASIAVARHRPPPVHGYAEIPVVGPILQSAWNRLGPLTFPLRARLGVNGVALVALLLGLGVVVALAVGFTALLDDVLEGEGLAQFDDPAAIWLAGHRELWLTNVLLVVTRIGNTGSQTVVMTLVCLLAAVTARAWAPVVVGLVGGLGIALIIVVAKHLVGRPRPPQPYALLSPHGLSFPSGHAAGAAAVGVLCAWMLCRWVVRRWPLQVGVWSVTIAAVGLIGFSRPYLGVHFVTDVLAGWLLGAAWAGSVILLAAWWLDSQRPSRAARNSVTPRC